MAIIKFSQLHEHNKLNPADMATLTRQGWAVQNTLYPETINAYTQEALRGAFSRLPVLVIPTTFAPSTFTVPNDNTMVMSASNAEVYYTYEVEKGGIEIALSTNTEDINVGQAVSITNVADSKITVNIGAGDPLTLYSGASLAIRRFTDKFMVVASSRNRDPNALGDELTLLDIINVLFPIDSFATVNPLHGEQGVVWELMDPGEKGALLAVGLNEDGGFNVEAGSYLGMLTSAWHLTTGTMPEHSHNYYYDDNASYSGGSASFMRPPSDAMMPGVQSRKTAMAGFDDDNVKYIGLDAIRKFGLPIYKRSA